MLPAFKRTLVVVVGVVAMAVLAAPKILPLIHPPATAAGNGRREAPRGAGGGAALRVTTVTLVPVPFAEIITATGTLRADEGVELQPEVNGKIAVINFTEGAQVHRGDLLLKLNDSELKAMLQRAVYRQEIAQVKERRFAQLLGTKNINQQDYDAALNEYSVQRAEVALVEAQLSKMEIRAPFDGVVGLRFVSEGAFITPTTRIATLQRIDRLKVDFSLPEKYASRVRLGNSLRFTVDGGEGEFSGEIYAIDPRIDAGTRTVLVRALCPNPRGRLFPGAFAGIELALDRVTDALLVPASAVAPGLTEKNVFVVRNGKAVRQPVKTGLRTPTSVQITEGLSARDVVITSGIQQLRSGQAVTIATEGSPPEKHPEEKPVGGKSAANKTATSALTGNPR